MNLYKFATIDMKEFIRLLKNVINVAGQHTKYQEKTKQ